MNRWVPKEKERTLQTFWQEKHLEHVLWNNHPQMLCTWKWDSTTKTALKIKQSTNKNTCLPQLFWPTPFFKFIYSHGDCFLLPFFGHFATSPQKVTEKHHPAGGDLRLREGGNDQAKAAPARVQASQKRNELICQAFHLSPPPKKKTDPPGNQHIPIPPWEVRKIIDSKVPFWGDMWSFPGGYIVSTRVARLQPTEAQVDSDFETRSDFTTMSCFKNPTVQRPPQKKKDRIPSPVISHGFTFSRVATWFNPAAKLPEFQIATLKEDSILGLEDNVLLFEGEFTGKNPSSRNTSNHITLDAT